MRVDILPYLARAAGVDTAVAATDFEKCRKQALRRNDGRDDSRSFILAVEAFRSKHPFDLGALPMDRSLDGAPAQV